MIVENKVRTQVHRGEGVRSLARCVRKLGSLDSFTLGLIGLGALFAVTRIYNLLAMPAFVDETIYLNFAHAVRHNPAAIWVSLKVDGKPPLPIWLFAVAHERIVPLLLAGRLVSVIAGSLASIFFFLTTRELTSSKPARLVALALFILSPLLLVHQRLALYESVLSLWAIATLYFSIRLFRQPTLRNSTGLGVAMGLALLTKQPSFFFLALAPLGFLAGKDRLKVANSTGRGFSVNTGLFFLKITGLFFPSVAFRQLL